MLFLDALLLRNPWCQNKQNQITSMIFNSNLYHSNLQMYIWICMCQKTFFYDVIYTFLYIYIYVYVLLIFTCFKCIISCKLRWEILLRLRVDKTQTWQLTMLLFMLLNFLMYFWSVNNVHFYIFFGFSIKSFWLIWGLRFNIKYSNG